MRESPTTTAFALVFTGTLLVALIQGPKPFYGDSGSYWSLASSFTRDGHFSLLNFESPLRGYAMALVAYALRTVGHGLRWSDSSVVKIFNATLFALLAGVLAPRIAQLTWQQRWGVGRRVALGALLVVFWSGDLNYPLSDFPGLALALVALIAIAHPSSTAWMLIAGVSAGLALDVRPAYLPLAPMLGAIVVWTWLRGRAPRQSLARRGSCVCLLVVGFVAASLPQTLSSYRHYHTLSFVPGGPADLTDRQLTASLLWQRYDTFARPNGEAFPMAYPDPAGERLLQQQPGHAITSPAQYLAMVADHPIAMAGIAARHLVNGLDMRYSTVYVEHLDSGGHLPLRLGGFLLGFLAIVRLLWDTARRSLGATGWRYPAALALCCLTSMVTAIETRFMLPVWLLGYLLVLAPGWPSPLVGNAAGLRRFRTAAILAIAYVVFMLAVWGVVGTAEAKVAG